MVHSDKLFAMVYVGKDMHALVCLRKPFSECHLGFTGVFFKRVGGSGTKQICLLLSVFLSSVSFWYIHRSKKYLNTCSLASLSTCLWCFLHVFVLQLFLWFSWCCKLLVWGCWFCCTRVLFTCGCVIRVDTWWLSRLSCRLSQLIAENNCLSCK